MRMDLLVALCTVSCFALFVLVPLLIGARLRIAGLQDELDEDCELFEASEVETRKLADQNSKLRAELNRVAEAILDLYDSIEGEEA